MVLYWPGPPEMSRKQRKSLGYAPVTDVIGTRPPPFLPLAGEGRGEGAGWKRDPRTPALEANDRPYFPLVRTATSALAEGRSRPCEGLLTIRPATHVVHEPPPSKFRASVQPSFTKYRASSK